MLLQGHATAAWLWIVSRRLCLGQDESRRVQSGPCQHSRSTENPGYAYDETHKWMFSSSLLNKLEYWQSAKKEMMVVCLRYTQLSCCTRGYSSATRRRWSTTSLTSSWKCWCCWRRLLNAAARTTTTSSASETSARPRCQSSFALFIYFKNRTRSTNIKDDIKHTTSHTSHIRRYK